MKGRMNRESGMSASYRLKTKLLWMTRDNPCLQTRTKIVRNQQLSFDSDDR